MALIKDMVRASFIAVLFVASCVSCGNGSPAKYVSQDTQARIRMIEQDEVVLLNYPESARDDGKGVICGGTWIGPHKILTAYHCAVAGTMTMEEFMFLGKPTMLGMIDITGKKMGFAPRADTDPNGKEGKWVLKRHEATVYKVDAARDLAVLKTNFASQHWARLSTHRLAAGEHVYASTMSGGAIYSYGEAAVSRSMRQLLLHEELKVYVNMVQLDSPYWHGASGCGVFDQDGKLQGVMSILLDNQTSLAFMIDKSEFVHVER